MKEDLLDANASVRWVEANLPSFEQRLNSWISDNVDVVVKELQDNASNDGLIFRIRENAPRDFTIEAGAYVNVLRSSLDILATAIGERDGVSNPDEIYFPIARSKDAFDAGKYKRAKFVNSLSGPHRHVIERIKPYPTGNNLLIALHDLDIRRKHCSLLRVEPVPDSITYGGRGWARNPYDLEFFGDLPGTRTAKISNYETLIAFVPKGFVGHQPNLKLTTAITFDEAVLSATPLPVALKLLIEMADRIILEFDI